MIRLRAFTLIELLVVVAIIGILSAVILAGLGRAQAMARDRARFADMRALITAIELAKEDGALPTAMSDIGPNFSNTIITRITPYLSQIPFERYSLDENGWRNYKFCNRNTTDAHCAADTDPNTYAIRFYTETRSIGGTTDFYCATSEGISLRENVGGTITCVQR